MLAPTVPPRARSARNREEQAMSDRGFGIAGGLDPAIVRAIASEAEARGYATFWANDTPTGEGLATLAEAAAVTERIRLGVGVLPLDRQPPEQILRRIEELRLPVERLTLGVGSGGAKGQAALDVVRAGCAALVGATAADVVVGALGPKMTALAGEASDGALLSWLIPAQAQQSAALVRSAAQAAGRPVPRVCSYFRVALGPKALPRLRAEAERYAGFPAYAAHFRRMGVQAIDTCVFGEDPAAVRAGLARFDTALDETVVRAIVAGETAEAYLALLRAVDPAQGQ
jgi:alkanesulfonate monooxygenase SsuD/methylene tetrahydromethanopterin reductase-like flavin-dependent oxidoreductase (luciferase family)